MKKLLMFVVICGCCLSGCALTNDKIYLNYKLSEPKEEVYQSKQKKEIAVMVDDKRDVNNPNFIFHKVNIYGMTMSGGYVSEEPIAYIVKSAIQDGLQQMNSEITNAEDYRYRFNCEIDSMAPKSIMGLWKGTYILEITTNDYIYDNVNNKKIWQEHIVGRGKIIVEGFPPEDLLQQGFNSALTDLVRKIQHSKMFQSTLRSNL